MSDFPEQRVINRFFRWYRERRFIGAYRVLRNASERHRDAGHNVHFKAVNEALICLECIDCPDFRPASHREEGRSALWLVFEVLSAIFVVTGLLVAIYSDSMVLRAVAGVAMIVLVAAARSTTERSSFRRWVGRP
jgi:hypothetical protein